MKRDRIANKKKAIPSHASDLKLAERLPEISTAISDLSSQEAGY
jgi:hypothetical protein